MKSFAYPFPHARGALTVAEYAQSEDSGSNEWERAYRDSHAHLERLFALNYRLIGRVLSLADAAEKTLDASPEHATPENALR